MAPVFLSLNSPPSRRGSGCRESVLPCSCSPAPHTRNLCTVLPHQPSHRRRRTPAPRALASLSLKNIGGRGYGVLKGTIEILTPGSILLASLRYPKNDATASSEKAHRHEQQAGCSASAGGNACRCLLHPKMEGVREKKGKEERGKGLGTGGRGLVENPKP